MKRHPYLWLIAGGVVLVFAITCVLKPPCALEPEQTAQQVVTPAGSENIATSATIRDTAASSIDAVPRLCASSSIVVDPASNSGSTLIEFCSDGPTKQALLTTGGFTSNTTRKGIDAHVNFVGTDNKPVPAYPLPAMVRGQSESVRVEVTNLWEAGESQAPLRINGIKTETLTAVKYRLPFGVKVDSPTPEKPVVVLQRNIDLDLILKNDDPVTYVVDWELTLPQISEHGFVILTPNQSAKIRIPALLSCGCLERIDNWFREHSSNRTEKDSSKKTIQQSNGADREWPGWFTGLLKDYEQDGKLTLSFRPPGATDDPYWPSKVVPITAQLRYGSDNLRSLVTVGLVVIILFAGAFLSFTASLGLPNRIERAGLKSDLDELAGRISGVSHHVDSCLRVMVRVQRMRLKDLLESRWSFSPDLTRVFQQVRDGRDTLRAQVELMERVDARHTHLNILAAEGNAPTYLEQIRQLLYTAGSLIRDAVPTQQDLASAKTQLDNADGIFSTMDHCGWNPADAPLIQQRVTQLEADLKEFADQQIYVQRIRHDSLPGLFVSFEARVREVPVASADQFARLDVLASKIEVIRDFLRIYQVSLETDRARFEAELPRLLACLSLESWDALRSARLILREMQEGVFPQELVRAIKANAAVIDIEPSFARQNDLIQWTVRFRNPQYNQASARDELVGVWDFDDGLEEFGWEVSHYFPRATISRAAQKSSSPNSALAPEISLRKVKPERNLGPYHVKFTVYTHDSVPDKAAPAESKLERDIFVEAVSQKWWQRDRNRAEILRFVIALFPVLFGLVTGAREQLQKTDLPTGIMTIFLLGFGSDTVKNLISKSQPSVSVAPPTLAATAPVQNGPAAPPAASNPGTPVPLSGGGQPKSEVSAQAGGVLDARATPVPQVSAQTVNKPAAVALAPVDLGTAKNAQPSTAQTDAVDAAGSADR